MRARSSTHSGQGNGFSNSMYRALVDNGLLIEIPIGGTESARAVQFGFERFADHLIAAHLVGSYDDVESLTRELDLNDTDRVPNRRLLTPGLLDALAILLPERHRVELPDAFPESTTASWIIRPLLRTLPWRDPDTIGPRCHELVNGAFHSIEGYELRQLLDDLVTCATIPGHPFGAESPRQPLASYSNARSRCSLVDLPALTPTAKMGLSTAYWTGRKVYTPTRSTPEPQSVWACAVVLTWCPHDL